MASYTYDAENHLLTAGGVTYTYDGDGQRLVKSSGTTYWYGAGSDPLFETDSGGYQIYLHYYFNGQRIGRREAWADGFWVDHYAYDALGNARFVYSFDGIDDESVYYPFGGERVISSGGHNQFKFTSKERDPESGLDNFGARYNSSNLGRFMTPDPLLSSGRPSNPQTWNRYAYALNNPLNIVDPNGLYDLVNKCASDDKKCNKKFKQHAKDLKNGISDLQKRVNKMKDGPEKQRLEASLTMLGTEGDHNGVGVTFASLPGTAAGQTDLNLNAGGQANPLITLDPSKNGSSTAYAINAAHEGTHIVDQTTELLHGYEELTSPSWIARSPILSDFSLEYRGYQTSAWAAQALGVPSLAYDGGKNVIWNSSWASADRQTLLDRGITQHVTSIPGHPETTPHNPWPN